jgi:hypothetical protein
LVGDWRFGDEFEQPIKNQQSLIANDSTIKDR